MRIENRTLFLAVGVAALLASRLDAAEIEWQTDEAKTLQRAASTRRPVIVFVTAPSCHYCALMHRKTFRDPSVVEKVNRSFAALAIDGEQRPQLMEQLGVRAFPTVLVVMPDRKVAAFKEGFQSPAEFQRFLDKAVKGAPAAGRQ
ncbi:MAG TPA: thioredoxin family protein [Pirellulales bacterium]|nr:thioredoxin family protein [Pirellulales bacterium]